MSETASKVTKQLELKLRELFDDDEFVEGILIYAYDERDRKTILDYINSGDDVSVETVTVLALNLCDQRDIAG